jgi:alpha-tubulin suppressor-like RCC1 family protein
MPVLAAGQAGQTISAGNGQGLRVAPDGTVWAWGWSAGLSPGTGLRTDLLLPLQVSGLTDVVAVDARWSDGPLALKTDGTVWTWPSYDLSQSPAVLVSTPRQIPGLTQVTAIAAGRLHVLALKTDGTVWAWGQNQRGELGNGTTNSTATPVQVQNLTGATAIAAGSQFSLALKSDGTVWSWGSSASGRLGAGLDVQVRRLPGPVSLPAGVVAIAAGYAHALALRADGSVWAWGENIGSQLGVEQRVLNGGIFPYEYVPVQVPQVVGATAISAGLYHSAAILSDATLLTWGDNSVGQLGLGDLRPVSPPAAVPGLGPVRAVTCGYYATYALLEDGQVFAWGLKLHGALGNGEDGTQRTPAPIPDLTDVTAMVATNTHTLALLSDGTVRAWGWNDSGQLGDGSMLTQTSPTTVPDLSDVVALTADNSHSLALKTDGTVWTWGAVWSGEPAEIVPPRYLLVPTLFDGLTDVQALSARNGHAVVLRSDGSVWAWGSNYYGEVSGRLYEQPYYATPIAVAGLPADITAIAACGRSNLALQSNGSVWAWGDGSTYVYGFLNFSSAAPAVVQGLSGIVKIACGDSQYFAFQDDGTTWIWGHNYAGVLGLGTSGDSFPPAKLEALPNLADAAGGESHSVALAKDGTVWAWGENAWGQVGDGARENRLVPTSLPTLTDIAGVFAGGPRSFAVTTDGRVFGWGRQGTGQLGDGSLEFTTSPVRMPDAAPPDLAAALTTTGGQDLTLVLTVTNQGGLILNGETTATVNLPEGLRLVPSQSADWSCDAGAPVVTCTTTSAFAGGQRSTIEMRIAHEDAGAGPLEISVELANAADTNPENNTATISVSFDTPAPARRR